MPGVADRITFEWVTEFKPNITQIEEEQAQRGYHPTGYGEPFDIETKALVHTPEYNGPNNYRTTWHCWASCD